MTRQNLATGWRGVDDEHESFMTNRIFNEKPLWFFCMNEYLRLCGNSDRLLVVRRLASLLAMRLVVFTRL